MLIITRKVGEKIKIGNDIEVVLIDIRGRNAKIGINAPKGVNIFREEIFKRISAENLRAAMDAPGVDELDKLKNVLGRNGHV